MKRSSKQTRYQATREPACTSPVWTEPFARPGGRSVHASGAEFL
jgi:hypothetical protein